MAEATLKEKETEVLRAGGWLPPAGAPAHANGQGPLRLDLGAGSVALPGFTAVDRKNGKEAYPLDYPDGVVQEIRASHVLEHFSHRQIPAVLADWVRVLAPGGKLRVAVPDFEVLAKQYLAGEPINLQGYVMGGHVDDDDRHGTIFDRELLTEVMIDAGLERIGRWTSDAQDCSSLPCSLNLQGFKPASGVKELKNVKLVYSTARFGPLLHCRCIERAVQALRLEAKGSQSCFWHQMLSMLMEDAIADPTCEYVLTTDYDTVFSPADVLELYRLMMACPDADAVFALQCKRGCEQALFTPMDGNGRVKRAVSDGDLARNLLPAITGHFGLTMIRADSLRKLSRPWMLPVPNAEGRWSDGQIDADITFWMRFAEAGFRFFLAPRVVVGHMEETIKWPGKELVPVYQTVADYNDNGIPPDVAR